MCEHYVLHQVVTNLHLRCGIQRHKNYSLHFYRINLASGCQSTIASAQVLLDIPHEEGLISNLLIIKFYLLLNLRNVKLPI